MSDEKKLIAGRYLYKLRMNILKSGMTAFFAVILLLLVIYFVLNTMKAGGFDVTDLMLSDRNAWAYVVLSVVVSLVTFVLMFYGRQKKDVEYLEKIASTMHNIAGGDLDTKVEVVGDDELSMIAEELNVMADDIQDLMTRERESERSKNELVTNVAHDLRTPLTSIRGYLELLQKNPNLSQEDRVKYTQIAFDKTKRLQDLIEELFGFTKMSYGKLSAKPTELDLMKLLEQLVDEFYPIFDNNEIEFEFEQNTDSIMMKGDGMLLARLFANLLNNAVKYGKDGKMIRMIVEYEEPLITIDVVNFGEVIPEDKLAKLFDKFYRVENSRSTQTGGTGLGLAIAKNIVELHGGQISVSSDLDGTVFRVKLRSDHDFEKEEFLGVEDV